MKMRKHHAVLALFAFLMASCTKDSIENRDATNIEAENIEAVEQELLRTVNDYRVSIGGQPLQFSSVAYTHANAHTDYMIARGNLSHDNFSSRASAIASEADAEIVAENVAKDYDTAQEALKGWLSSTHHKSTIEGTFTHTAVSVKRDAAGNFYFTQLFYR